MTPGPPRTPSAPAQHAPATPDAPPDAAPPPTTTIHDFHAAVLDHLDAAFNFARWLTRNDHDAADAVQDACLRALRFFSSFRGGDSKAWLLRIVRNAVHSQQRQRNLTEALPPEPSPVVPAPSRPDVAAAIAGLAPDLREVLVLREIEGLSYAQIATALDIPMGTVMSRLSRARDAARTALTSAPTQEPD